MNRGGANAGVSGLSNPLDYGIELSCAGIANPVFRVVEST